MSSSRYCGTQPSWRSALETSSTHILVGDQILLGSMIGMFIRSSRSSVRFTAQPGVGSRIDFEPACLIEIAEQLAHRRRIERAEIVGLVRHARLPGEPRGLGAVEHRDELVGVPARADHRHRQVQSISLNSLSRMPSRPGPMIRRGRNSEMFMPRLRHSAGEFLGLRAWTARIRRAAPPDGLRSCGWIIGVAVDHVGGVVDQRCARLPCPSPG